MKAPVKNLDKEFWLIRSEDGKYSCLLGTPHLFVTKKAAAREARRAGTEYGTAFKPVKVRVVEK